MFKAVLKDGGCLWKKLVECLKELVDDVCFEIDGDGIRMEAMDTARVCLINLELQSSQFDSYMFDGHEPTIVSLPLGNMTKILKFAENDATITFMADEYDTSYVKFVFENISSSTRCDFRVSTLCNDGTRSTYEVPEINYSANVTMPSADLAKTCKDLATLAGTVHATVDAEGFTLKSEGDIGVARVAFKKGEHITIQRTDEVELDLGVRHMVSMTRAANLSDTVQLSLENNYPIRASFQLDKGIGTLSYYLAPRLSESDEEEFDDN